MSYAKLGVNCYPITVAFTSNEKFFPISAPVYKERGVVHHQSSKNLHEDRHNDDTTNEKTHTCTTCHT